MVIQEIWETLSIKGCLTTGLVDHRAFLGLKFAGGCHREDEKYLLWTSQAYPECCGLPPGGLPVVTHLPSIYHQGWAGEFAFAAWSFSVAL